MQINIWRIPSVRTSSRSKNSPGANFRERSESEGRAPGPQGFQTLCGIPQNPVGQMGLAILSGFYEITHLLVSSYLALLEHKRSAISAHSFVAQSATRIPVAKESDQF